MKLTFKCLFWIAFAAFLFFAGKWAYEYVIFKPDRISVAAMYGSLMPVFILGAVINILNILIKIKW